MIVFRLLAHLLQVFLLFLVFRLVIDWVLVFARHWRPGGVLAAMLELTYTVTDPPLRLLRRFIPPLRLGNVALDLGFLVLFFLVTILIGVLNSAAR